MFDIITFGSATIDVFAILKPLKQKGQLCFKGGAKENLANLFIESGGGGTNTAASFANFGLKTAYCGEIGADIWAELIKNDLKKRNINLVFLRVNKKNKSSVSLILSPEKGERVILSSFEKNPLSRKNLPLSSLKTKWFYLAPLHNQSVQILKPLVKFAYQKKIKIALNPSKEQIQDLTSQEIEKIDCLIVNQEEFALLKEKVEKFTGILVITQGAMGCLVKDIKNKREYLAMARDIKMKEATGAGDAFASGFITGLFLKNDIQYSIRLGLFNSECCIQEIGAKNGLMKRQDLVKIPFYQIKEKICK
ncbi:carbohydrate kinase family protein [Candidatus Gribaldobacteria bacterium]|nr:carbohydrate kinase family protein [Candidatus Gribaldobacteria bacterium]